MSIDVEKLMPLVRRELKKSGYKMRKQRHGSYDVTSLEGDLFWWYSQDGFTMSWELMWRPGSKFRDGRTTIHERTINAHLQHCVSLLKLDVT